LIPDATEYMHNVVLIEGFKKINHIPMIGLEKYEVAKIGGPPVLSNYAWHLVEKFLWLHTQRNTCQKMKLFPVISLFDNFIKYFINGLN
jgi:molybdopterin-guanine dinucleotide biosynthesis protein